MGILEMDEFARNLFPTEHEFLEHEFLEPEFLEPEVLEPVFLLPVGSRPLLPHQRNNGRARDAVVWNSEPEEDLRTREEQVEDWLTSCRLWEFQDAFTRGSLAKLNDMILNCEKVDCEMQQTFLERAVRLEWWDAVHVFLKSTSFKLDLTFGNDLLVRKAARTAPASILASAFAHDRQIDCAANSNEAWTAALEMVRPSTARLLSKRAEVLTTDLCLTLLKQQRYHHSKNVEMRVFLLKFPSLRKSISGKDFIEDFEHGVEKIVRKSGKIFSPFHKFSKRNKYLSIDAAAYIFALAFAEDLIFDHPRECDICGRALSLLLRLAG